MRTEIESSRSCSGMNAVVTEQDIVIQNETVIGSDLLLINELIGRLQLVVAFDFSKQCGLEQIPLIFLLGRIQGNRAEGRGMKRRRPAHAGIGAAIQLRMILSERFE